MLAENSFEVPARCSRDSLAATIIWRGAGLHSSLIRLPKRLEVNPLNSSRCAFARAPGDKVGGESWCDTPTRHVEIVPKTIHNQRRRERLASSRRAGKVVFELLARAHQKHSA